MKKTVAKEEIFLATVFIFCDYIHLICSIKLVLTKIIDFYFINSFDILITPSRLDLVKSFNSSIANSTIFLFLSK